MASQVAYGDSAIAVPVCYLCYLRHVQLVDPRACHTPRYLPPVSNRPQTCGSDNPVTNGCSGVAGSRAGRSGP